MGEPQVVGAVAPPERSTRGRILDEAEALIAELGLDGLQLKDVAARVGIRPPSVFAHFAGRQAISNAVAERVLSQLVEVLETALARDLEPEAVIRGGVRDVVEHLVDRPAHVRLLLRDLARSSQSADVDLTASPDLERAIDRLAEILRAGERQGCFRPVDATHFLAQMEGSILANIAFPGWENDGRPVSRHERERLCRDAETLALALLRPAA